jgi:hypothetical protein
MKIFGFYDDKNDSKFLDQVTLEVNASELRELAEFFFRCAEEMDSDEGWGHEHLSDYLGRVLEQDLILYNSKKSGEG